VATKLQNRDEFVRWYNEGKTGPWIVAEYARKYGITISTGTVSNWRHSLGIEATRQARDAQLIPWTVKAEHRTVHAYTMLRGEARRRRFGEEALDATLLRKVYSFTAKLRRQGAVVHYDPDHPRGFAIVPARPGVDTDLVRIPDKPTRQRGNRQ
jgi:hypothetical protein